VSCGRHEKDNGVNIAKKNVCLLVASGGILRNVPIAELPEIIYVVGETMSNLK